MQTVGENQIYNALFHLSFPHISVSVLILMQKIQAHLKIFLSDWKDMSGHPYRQEIALGMQVLQDFEHEIH